MAHFEDVDAKYLSILHKIESLRLKGISDSHPEMIRSKIALRDCLELKKRNSTAIQKVVPRLTGIKTISIPSKQLGDATSSHNKYFLLGAALGLCALLYFYFNGGVPDNKS
jgi:hypothetical protein